MSKLRTKILTPVPSVIQDAKIDGNWGKTFRSEQILLFQDSQAGVVIFCTDQALSLLIRSKIIFCDGNFRKAPEPFVQIFCLHAIIQVFKIPMAWAFRGCKTEQHYDFLFVMLRAKALEKFQQDFAPEKNSFRF